MNDKTGGATLMDRPQAAQTCSGPRCETTEQAGDGPKAYMSKQVQDTLKGTDEPAVSPAVRQIMRDYTFVLSELKKNVPADVTGKLIMRTADKAMAAACEAAAQDRAASFRREMLSRSSLLVIRVRELIEARHAGKSAAPEGAKLATDTETTEPAGQDAGSGSES